MSTDNGSPVVIDNGTSTIKAGFAGNDFPPLVFPSNVGESGLVGSKAFKKRFQVGLTHPIKNGIISDWNSMEIIWDHVFTELNADSKTIPSFSRSLH
ncbi:hypothetical protein CRE_24309 [Caenorhabditis remanei]|uniref:Actin n=1 Tax=Caenorhabditis remanei TaxID=31234 RepID=E3NP82_CAERE|nr:hypothetical protein CRE_24309 [Caenorhabditis remanei]